MEWFIAAVAVVALGVAAVVAAGGGGSMAREPVRDTYAMAVGDDPLDASDVRHLRFGIALRGYAMDQVDAILDRLAQELEARDARIVELQELVAQGGEIGPPEDVAPEDRPGPDLSTAEHTDVRAWDSGASLSGPADDTVDDVGVDDRTPVDERADETLSPWEPRR